MANTVTASYFVGDGSGLTNISGSVGVDSNGNLIQLWIMLNNFHND